jgi:microcystin-dependent protein
MLLFSIFSVCYGQTDGTPFSYQGYALNFEGQALSAVNINVRVSIYPLGGANVYQEEHNLQTDMFGVYSISVGSVMPNDFKKINFSKQQHGMRVEVKRIQDASYITMHNEALDYLPYARSAANGLPVGSIVSFAGEVSQVPAGWMLCDGTSISAAQYAQLFHVIGNSWGGNGTNFNVPDLRGRFLRGVSADSNNDPDKNSRTASAAGGNTGNNVGSLQTEGMKSHNHTMESAGAHSHGLEREIHRHHRSFSGANDAEHTLIANSGTLWTSGVNSAGAHTHTINAIGGSESRPKNVNVHYIIKY